jgi:hypothetical protein
MELKEWFQYFPDSYVVAMSSESMAIFREYKVGSGTDYEQLTNKLRAMNNNGAGIFFTPNAINDVTKRHAADNLGGYNAWYIDLDIPGGKGRVTEEVALVRATEKRRILEHISGCKIRPTFTCESRNGFHLFWLRDRSRGVESGYISECFSEIEHGIAKYFEGCGADTSTTKPVTLLRVPGFDNHKHGESFRVTVIESLGCFGAGGNPKRYTEVEMMKAFPAPEKAPTPYKLPKIYRKIVINKYKVIPETGELRQKHENDDIFEKVHSLNIEEVLSRLSGHGVVGGRVFEIRKRNVYIDGKATPAFINRNENKIFARKGDGPTITQFLHKFGHSYAYIAEVYKELF